MDVNDSIETKDWDKHCLVCGKSVEEGEGMCHIKAGERMIALCCPLCIETFNKDPKRYLRLRQVRELDAQIRHPSQSEVL